MRFLVLCVLATEDVATGGFPGGPGGFTVRLTMSSWVGNGMDRLGLT